MRDETPVGLTGPLFRRDPVTLDGYVPKYSEQEILLGYRAHTYQVSGRGMRGFGMFMDSDEDPEPKYETTHYITVAGYEMTAPVYSHIDKHTAVVQIANAFLSNKNNAVSHPAAWDFLVQNGPELSESNRYWSCVRHLRQIAAKEEEIAEMQRHLDRSKLISQVNIYEVLEGRKFNDEERRRVFSEFSGQDQIQSI